MKINLWIYGIAIFFISAGITAIACGEGNDEAEWLRVHNEARAKKGVRPLRWSKPLEYFAKEHLKTLKMRGCKMYHSKESGYGENLWMAWGYKEAPPVANTVQAWLNEEKYYDPKNPKWCSGGECMHYTQVMWGAATEIGCSTISCQHKNKPAYIRSCNYDIGNVWGRKPY